MSDLGNCRICDKQMKQGFFVSIDDAPYWNDSTVCRNCGDKERLQIRSHAESDSEEAAKRERKDLLKRVKLLSIDTIPDGYEPIDLVQASVWGITNEAFGRNLKDFADWFNVDKAVADVKEMTSSSSHPNLTKFASETVDNCSLILKQRAQEIGAEAVVAVKVSQTAHSGAIMIVTMIGTALKRADGEGLTQ